MKNIFFILLFILLSCQDNYENCLDLEYGTEFIKITGVSESDKNYFKYFCKTTEVFGIKIYATENVANEKVLHAASVLYEYLDNDEDGTADNQKIEVNFSSLHEYRYGGEMINGASHFAMQAEERIHDILMGNIDYNINFLSGKC